MDQNIRDDKEKNRKFIIEGKEEMMQLKRKMEEKIEGTEKKIERKLKELVNEINSEET